MDFFASPTGMALLAGLVTWSFTAVGAAMVFAAKEFSRLSLDVMLGFAARSHDCRVVLVAVAACSGNGFGLGQAGLRARGDRISVRSCRAAAAGRDPSSHSSDGKS